MSKHTIIGVIVLMSISLIGVVGLQLYWITDAIKVRQEQFDRSVYDALAKVVAKLETREAVSVVNEQMAALDTSKITTDTVAAQAAVPVQRAAAASEGKGKKPAATSPNAVTKPEAKTHMNISGVSTAAPASPESFTVRGLTTGTTNLPSHSGSRTRYRVSSADSAEIAFLLKNKLANGAVVYHDLIREKSKDQMIVYNREPQATNRRDMVLKSADSARSAKSQTFTARLHAMPDVHLYKLNDSALTALTQRSKSIKISVDTLVFLASQFDSLRRYDKNLGINPADIRAVNIRNDSIIVIKNQKSPTATTFRRSVTTSPVEHGIPLREHAPMLDVRSIQEARQMPLANSAATATVVSGVRGGGAVPPARPATVPVKPTQPEPAPARTSPSPQRIEVKKDKISDVVEKMVVEYVVRELPLKERLNLSNFESLLQAELENQGIDLNYGYWIVSNTTDTVATRPIPHANLQALPVYKASLFPNDIFDKADYVGVTFPESKTYALKSLWFMLLCSIGFTLIIMVTFGTTIHIIYKQKKLSEMKNDFINNMTHEFKTPIATISLATDSISNPKVFEKPERIQYYTKIIREENKRMNAQVENVLQIALLEKNEFRMNLQPVDVHELVMKAVDSIRLQVEQRTGQVTAHLNALQHELQSDEVHLYNVICNLLDNANKYSPATPDIHLITQNVQGGLVIAVEDKGMGMSKDTQQRVFDKFYRVPTGNLHNVKGFGLGLSYVKAIVQAHHGDIKLKSELGKGSRFEIFLPFRD